MLVRQIANGQEVTLRGDDSGWLLVDRIENNRVRLRRSIGESAGYSAGFWTDADLIREARWPQR